MLVKVLKQYVHHSVPKNPQFYQDNSLAAFQLLCELLGKPRRPPAHALVFEVFEHMCSDYMYSRKTYLDFPSIQEEFPMHKNITLMHLSMLLQRLEYEETKEALAEAFRLQEVCEKYAFERYLDLVEHIVDLPVQEFEMQLVEMLVNDLDKLNKLVACYGYGKKFIVLDPVQNYDMKQVIIK